MPASRPRPRKTYHHGDLRAALIDAARELVRDEGPSALSLRAVARRAGVSQTAPYRHFDDRRALVGAVAAEGFRELRSRIREGVSTATDGKRALLAVAECYVAFAMDRPSEYRLMFGAELAEGPPLPELEEASVAVFDLLRGGIASLKRDGRLVGRPVDDIATACWAMMHGLVMLVLDQQVATGSEARIEELVKAATGILMDGMAKR